MLPLICLVQVEKGKRYRFRTIQGANSWGVKVQPLNHTITIIAVDGALTEPYPAKGYIVNAGERVDFILEADQPVCFALQPPRALPTTDVTCCCCCCRPFPLCCVYRPTCLHVRHA
jgi:FtsP/CotA-like multicopper oxidase with cupredoxin domain